MKKVIIVFKSHLDNGYTDLSKQVLHNYCTSMLDNMLDTCEATAALPEGSRYVWTMPAWLLYHIRNSSDTNPLNKKRLDDCISRRQVVWIQTPFTIHTEFSGLEEIIRGFHFSDELSRLYHYTPLSAKMTDVPGHTSYLASLLNRQGVKFMHLGCNPCCMPPDVPTLFWWQGSDGKQILTMYNKGSYGSSILPPQGWKYPVWLYLAQTNDNLGCHTKEEVEKLLSTVRKELPNAEIVIGTLDDFYWELSQYNLHDLPVVRKDLADTWIHGIGSYPKEVSFLRRIRPMLSVTEQISALLNCNKQLTDKEQTFCLQAIQNAYDQALLFDEHTWGMAGLTGLGRNRPYRKKEFLESLHDESTSKIQRSWDEQRDRAWSVCKKTNELKSFVMHRLADTVLNSENELLVYNGLSWNRSGFVPLNISNSWIDGYSLFDTSTNTPVPLFFRDDQWIAFVKDIPATGWKILIRQSISAPTPSQHIANPLSFNKNHPVLENQRFKITLDPIRGGIVSFYDKKQQYEYVDPRIPWAEYSYDIHGDKSERRYVQNYVYRFISWVIDDLCRINMPEQKDLTFKPQCFSFEKEVNGCMQILKWTSIIKDASVTEYGNAKTVSFVLSISDMEDFVDLSIFLENKQPCAFPESASLSLPFSLKNCKIKINKIGSILDPQKDFEKDANHVLYCCENWVALEGDKNGMLIIPWDTPLFGIQSKGIYEFQSQRKEISSHLYFNLFNTQWGTNFPQWINGDFSWKFRFIPLNNTETTAEKQRLALNAVTPLLAEKKHSSFGPSSKKWYHEWLHCETMRILSIFSDISMNHIHIRLMDITNTSGNALLFVCPDVKQIWIKKPGDGFHLLTSNADGSYLLKTKANEIHELYAELY